MKNILNNSWCYRKFKFNTYKAVKDLRGSANEQISDISLLLKKVILK